MPPAKPVQPHSARRIIGALRAILPPTVDLRPDATRNGTTTLALGTRKLRAVWVGEGGLRHIRPVLAMSPEPHLAVARVMSQGARDALAKAGIGWADETGAAEIALGTIIVSRTGQRLPPPDRTARWTPAAVAVAETLLCGTTPTVAATHMATGLSMGSCINALKALAELGLLTSARVRGPGSARRVVDHDALLDAYAAAVQASPARVSLVVGLAPRDLVKGLHEVGVAWTRGGLDWAATGAAAAALLAPFATNMGSVEVYVDARTSADLVAVAARAGLAPIEGGRLTLRPFPSMTTSRMVQEIDGIRVAPWPRVYADVSRAGVRGEELAEHLREVVRGR